MRFKNERSEVVSRAQAGTRLIALGQALVGGGELALPADGDEPHVDVPDEVSVTYEVKLDEQGRGKLEIELRWPVISGQHQADSTVALRPHGRHQLRDT